MRRSIASALLFLCACAAKPPASHTVANPDFVVFRAVGTDPSAGSATVSMDGRTYHFNPAERVVDLREIDADSCRAERTPLGGWAVYGKLTPDGGRKFGQWTLAHINQQLGIFVGGRLISAPFIRSRIDDAFVIEGAFTQAEVEEVVARLRSGGSSP
ncbi:MAG TPA: hypothetical protein VG323_08095 [Thermoanaerobaculia bacterium]|nr:hypothetical protein [Thermoanaerobaculia bacterium]